MVRLLAEHIVIINWRIEMAEEEKSKVSPQSLGGQARAKVLSHNEKVAIARSGGEKRDDVLSSAEKHKIAVKGNKASQE